MTLSDTLSMRISYFRRTVGSILRHQSEFIPFLRTVCHNLLREFSIHALFYSFNLSSFVITSHFTAFHTEIFFHYEYFSEIIRRVLFTDEI